METIKALHTISPGVFWGGRIIYSETANPYETIKVYLLLKKGLLLGHYISEHGPDGGTSWKLINLDVANFKKLKQVIEGKNPKLSVKSFLKKEFYATEAATSKFVDFLNENGIVYEYKYYF